MTACSRTFVVAINMRFAARHDGAADSSRAARRAALHLCTAVVPVNDEPVDVSGIEAEIIRLHATGHLTECGYDPAWGTLRAAAAGGVPVAV